MPGGSLWESNKRSVDIIADGQKTRLYSVPGGLLVFSAAGSEAAVEKNSQCMMFHLFADS